MVTGLQHGYLSWKNSTASGTGACVEVARAGETIVVRDSKSPSGPVLTFSETEWEAFLAGAPAEAFLAIVKDALPFEDRSERLQRLVRLVLGAAVVVVLGITVIIVLVVTTVPGSTVAAGLGVSAIGGGGIAMVRLRRAARRAALPDIPRPREAAAPGPASRRPRRASRKHDQTSQPSETGRVAGRGHRRRGPARCRRGRPRSGGPRPR